MTARDNCPFNILFQMKWSTYGKNKNDNVTKIARYLLTHATDLLNGDGVFTYL